MAYFKIYDDASAEVTAGNPLDFGTLNRDDQQVSSWVLASVRADNGLKSSGNTTITVVDSTGADSSNSFQLAAWTTGDTTGPAATPEAYGADLTFATVVNDTTGVNFWVRRKAELAETPVTDTTAIVRATGVVIPE